MKTLPLLALAFAAAVTLPSCVVPDGGPPPRPRPHGPVAPGGLYDTRGRDRDHDHRGPDSRWDGRRDDDRRRDDRRPGYSDHRPGGPSRGGSLPAGARRVEVRGSTYYTAGGVWYRSSGGSYVVTRSPY